jgi:8-oxo-dGTP pyrophosphatase MutT (NUDIX family)
MRERGSVVLLENDRVALIKRKRGSSVVFPGGGIEKGETPEQAAKREAYEELGVGILVEEHLVKVAFHGTQYFVSRRNDWW